MAAKEMQNPRMDAQAEEQAHHLCCRFSWLALVQGGKGKTRQAFGGLHPLANESRDEVGGTSNLSGGQNH